MTQAIEVTHNISTKAIDELTKLRAEVKALRELAMDLQWKVRGLQHPIVRTEYPHIIKVEGKHGGSPLLSESYISVKTIAAFTKQGFSPERLVEEYGGELTLAQVHEALAYYYRHCAEIAAYLAADETAELVSRQQAHTEIR